MTASGTETLAVEQADGTFRLHGYKWFSSATDANMTFTLARIVDRNGQVVQVGVLSCFVVQLTMKLMLPLLQVSYSDY